MLHQRRGLTNRPLIVLDPNLDPRFEADFMTDDPETFLKYVWDNESCELAIDEGGETIGRYAKDMAPLATRGRHFGHACTFIAQRCQQIDTNVRNQCTTLLLFSVSKKDAELLAAEWVDDTLLNAYKLDKGAFYLKRKFSPTILCNAFNL